MRFIHSRSIIHRNLTPDNILLDLDWKVRICNFRHSISTDQPTRRIPADPGGVAPSPDVISRYTAPETHDRITVLENDVFSFGMILYELIVGRPAFPKNMTPLQVQEALVLDNWRLDIPDNVIPVTAELIRDCVALDYRDRPSFTEILQRLEVIDFKLIAGVNSVKIASFVTAIENQEM
jgi:serine/threonine protein kinase